MTDEALADAEEQQPQEKVEIGVKSKGKNKGTGDLVADVAAKVEGLTKEKLRARADELADDIEANYFELGGVLKKIMENGWFEGYDSFQTFVFERYGFQKRKAEYLMGLYDHLVTKFIPWEKVSHLGWTKVALLASVLTLDNLDEWVAKAEALSVVQLVAALKAKPEGGGDGTTSDEVVTLKFKFHKDQAETAQHAIAKAKGEFQTEYDTVAAESIFAGYLAGQFGAAPSTAGDLKGMMKDAGWEAVLGAFDELFPEINLAVTLPDTEGGEQAAA